MSHDDRTVQRSGTPLLERPPFVMSWVQTIVRWANRLAERVDRSRVPPITLLCLLYLAVTVVLAQRKLMWNDELYT